MTKPREEAWIDNIKSMFALVEQKKVRKSTRQFVASLRKWFDERGGLTPKQEAALEAVCERIRDGSEWHQQRDFSVWGWHPDFGDDGNELDDDLDPEPEGSGDSYSDS